MTRWIIHSLLASSMLIAMASVSAENGDLLATIPTPYFTESDRSLLRSTLMVALEADGDGTSRHWKNPATANRGRIKVIESSRDRQYPCRVVRVTNYTAAAHPKTSTVITVCRLNPGQWAIQDIASRHAVPARR